MTPAEIQKAWVALPDKQQRLETGPVQFTYEHGETDWPGVFIRGDNAAHYALHLRRLLDSNEALDWVALAALQGLLSDLEGSRI